MSRWPYSTGTWQRLRRAKLTESPLCEACIRTEIVERATVVDHIVSIEKGGDPFPPLAGLMSMCAPCHNRKTRAVDMPDSTAIRRALKGFDVEGNPIDGTGWDAPAGRHGPRRGRGASKDERSIASDRRPTLGTDLVSCEPFATGRKEPSRWV